MKKRAQLKLPETLPTLRHAEAEMWAAYEERETWAEAVEKDTATLAETKEGLAQAEKTLRAKMFLLREVRNDVNARQTKIEPPK